MKVMKQFLVIITTIAFLANNVMVIDAFSGGRISSDILSVDDLAAESRLAPIETPALRDVMKLTATIMYEYAEKGRDINAIRRNIIVDEILKEKGTEGIERPGDSIIFNIRKKQEYGDGDLLVIPCSINDNSYVCCAIKEEMSGTYVFKVFTPEEYENFIAPQISSSVANAMEFVARLKREVANDAAIMTYAAHENTADKIIHEAITSGKAETLDIGSVGSANEFIEWVNPAIAKQFKNLVASGQLMSIPGLSEPHAGGVGIYIPEGFAGSVHSAIVHEVFAKAGLEHKQCREMEKIFSKWLSDPENLVLTAADKALLAVAGERSFETRWQTPDKVDYYAAQQSAADEREILAGIQNRKMRKERTFEIRKFSPDMLPLIQKAGILQFGGLAYSDPDEEEGFVLISTDASGEQRIEIGTVIKYDDDNDTNTIHWIQAANWNRGADKELYGLGDTMVFYFMEEFGARTLRGSPASAGGTGLLGRTGISHEGVDSDQAASFQELMKARIRNNRHIVPVGKYRTKREYFTLDEVDVEDRTVSVRVDINTTLTRGGKVTTNNRIKAAAVTLKELSDRGAKTVVMGHQGRPGDKDYLETMEQHAAVLKQEMEAIDPESGRKYDVIVIDDLFGDTAKDAIRNLKPGQILILKNVRSWKGEQAKGVDHSLGELVENLQPLIDIHVIDGFSVAHRAAASVVGFTGVPNVAGRLMEKELTGLGKATEEIEQPYVMALGGIKIDDYLDLMERALSENWVSTIITGGGLANVLLMARGIDIGEANVAFLRSKMDLDAALAKIKELDSTYKGKFMAPVDVVVKGPDGVKVVKVEELAGTDLVLYDIGPETVGRYLGAVDTAKTIYIKGPLGAFDIDDAYAEGTRIVFGRISERSEEGDLFSFGGGGDTDKALDIFGDRFSYQTLAGGATLQYLAGQKPLPAVQSLKKATEKGLAWNMFNMPPGEQESEESEAPVSDVIIDKAAMEIAADAESNKMVFIVPQSFAGKKECGKFINEVFGKGSVSAGNIEFVQYNQYTDIGRLHEIVARYKGAKIGLLTTDLTYSVLKEIVDANPQVFADVLPMNFSMQGIPGRGERHDSFVRGVLETILLARTLPSEEYRDRSGYTVLKAILSEYLSGSADVDEYIANLVDSGKTVNERFSYVIGHVLRPIVPMDIQGLDNILKVLTAA